MLSPEGHANVREPVKLLEKDKGVHTFGRDTKVTFLMNSPSVKIN